MKYVPETISSGQAADLLKVSVSRINQLIREGRISCVPKKGKTRTYKIKPESLKKLKNKKTGKLIGLSK